MAPQQSEHGNAPFPRKKDPDMINNGTRRTLAGNGLIVAHHGVAVEVLFDDGCRRMARVKRNSGHVVGDNVRIAGETLTRLPRQTELKRRDARGGVHLVAANLDTLGIVVAPHSPAGFIDRGIVAARSARLVPFVVVNKCDLQEGTALAKRLGEIYDGLIPLFPLSVTTRSGFDPLLEFLGTGHRGAFVGSTGVGKSSLMNAICPHINLQVGRIGDYKDMGRHTTTVSTLHALPSGGELVDTPGFRDFGLVDISTLDLAIHFPGFENSAGEACRFSNCRHSSEPGCAIIAAVEHGHITAERYKTYLEIRDEIETEEERSRTRGWRK